MGRAVGGGGGAGPVLRVGASMGEKEEGWREKAISCGPAYLAVVGSRKRFAELRESLLSRGVPAEELDKVRNPAGLDVGARTPEEAALSLFAETVPLRGAAQPAHVVEPQTAGDPVCGLNIHAASARHQAV